jgi:uncharacterized protein (TIGR02145 family)
MAGKIFGKCSMIRMECQMIVILAFLFLSGCTAYDPEPFATYPDVKTGAPSLVLIHTVVMSADVTDENGLAVKSRGFCWSSVNPFPTLQDDTLTSGSGEGPFTDTIFGLTGEKTYYIRAFATTNKGTGYGAALTLRTADTTVRDIDGHVYRVIQSGYLIWMAENLRVTRFRNGDPVPEVQDNSGWMTRDSAARCWYQNDEGNREIYGALYNGQAINDPRKLAPEGWHIALFQEWQYLANTLGGSLLAGGYLKETGTEHWLNPNAGAADLIGFTALPGGYRDGADGTFKSLHTEGRWWTASQAGEGRSWFYRIYHFSAILDYDKSIANTGFSVRCVKNNP